MSSILNSKTPTLFPTPFPIHYCTWEQRETTYVINELASRWVIRTVFNWRVLIVRLLQYETYLNCVSRILRTKKNRRTSNTFLLSPLDIFSLRKQLGEKNFSSPMIPFFILLVLSAFNITVMLQKLYYMYFFLYCPAKYSLQLRDVLIATATS